MARYVVEVTVFDALAKKLKLAEEKALQGLTQVSIVVKDPDKLNGTMYDLCVKFAVSYVIRKVGALGQAILVDHVCQDTECNKIIGFKLISNSMITPAIVDSIVDEFLTGYGKCLEIVWKSGPAPAPTAEVEVVTTPAE